MHPLISPLSAPLVYHNLSLVRGGNRLFSGLSFTLERGAGLAICGSNGSGKSSLLRGLAGLLEFEAGEVAQPPSLIYIGHRLALKDMFSIDETLEFYSNYFAAPFTPDIFSKIKNELGLTKYASAKISSLSAGQKQRLALARFIIGGAHAPLWLLDEPFANLDDNGRGYFTALIKTHLHAGGAAAIATHAPLDFATRNINLDELQ